MLLLTSEDETLNIVTSSSERVDVRVDYADYDSVLNKPVDYGSSRVSIQSAGETTIVPAPASGRRRNVVELSVCLRRTATGTNSIRLLVKEGSTPIDVYAAVLSPGDTLLYMWNTGWVLTSFSGPPSVLKAGSGPNDTSYSNVLVPVVSKQFDCAVGDVIEYTAYAVLRNQSGASSTLTIGASLGSKNLVITGSASVATNTGVPVYMMASFAILSDSLLGCSIRGVLNPVSTAGSSVTTVTRFAWSVSTGDFRGTQTASILVQGSALGSHLYRGAGYKIEKHTRSLQR